MYEFTLWLEKYDEYFSVIVDDPNSIYHLIDRVPTLIVTDIEKLNKKMFDTFIYLIIIILLLLIIYLMM